MNQANGNANLIQIWQLHPQGCRVTPADPIVGGSAPLSARQYCGPYTHANGTGFYLYSPVDIDLTYEGDDRWRYDITGEFWSDAEVLTVDAMCGGQLTPDLGRFLPRTKLFLSGGGSEPGQTAQLWTGCIFRTPPGWSLWLRSPVNRNEVWPFRVEEAILETGWLQQDIWLNLHFLRTGETAQLRRNGPPIAHIIPIAHSSYANWSIEQRNFHVTDPESTRVFQWWLEYNHEKFCSPTAKERDMTVYHRRRQRERC